MVELGAYGVWRVYGTVFAGPGGIPAAGLERALVILGTLTAVLGAFMCWHQRHIKRLPADSTIAHTGLFLIGLGVLTPAGGSGTALYLLGHAGVKAALFACAGILLDRYGNVGERALHGRARELRTVGVLFTVGGLALAGLPPFGTGLGKSVAEEAVGVPLTVLYVGGDAGAVLRVAARVFLGAGDRPPSGDAYETTGSGEEPETEGRLDRVPGTMTAVPAVLLAGALAAGLAPGLPAVLAHAVDRGRTPADVHWTCAGVLLGCLSTLLAVGLAALAVVRPGPLVARGRALPLRRPQSGHVGDHVAWLLVGAAALGAPALPGVLGG